MTGEAPSTTLRDLLRRALDDPRLEIVFPRVGSQHWIDAVGCPAVALEFPDRAVTSVEYDGKPIAALVHAPDLLNDPERLRIATAAVTSAIDNERTKAALRSELLEVQDSRARIIEAADVERRRVERNLHDGAQQRLVGLALTLRLAQRQAEANPGLLELLTDSLDEVDEALAELRRLARGLHPAIVADAGLRTALETLAERPGLPVDLALDIPGRLPERVEIAAYYLVAEALANTNKHAQARRVEARAEVVDDALRLSVSDDGRGGAEAAPGSGLQGLIDRVAALGGKLAIASLPDRGTTIAADIPLRLPPDLDHGRRSRVALTWIGWENWEAPGILYDQITDEDLHLGAKAMLLCAGGNTVITQAERDWTIGYLTAAGDSERVIDMVRTYDDSDRLEDVMALPSMSMLARGVLYDGIRICAADGPLTAQEWARLTRSIDILGVPAETLASLAEIIEGEHALRRRRYELITVPILAAAGDGRGPFSASIEPSE